MGEVYRACDVVLGRQVAVKLLLPAHRDPVAAERFHREARAAAKLSDPHLVAAYDFGPHEDGCFLVMELVEGRTVAEELQRCGPFPADRAIDIIRQTAAGLATAHRHGIVHRDIKPGNLLLADDGTVKIGDFGIARFLSDTTTTLTALGQVLGTSYYLAPERAQGEPAGKPSDVYALGCVLYQLATGHPPFQADLPVCVMYQHVSTEPTPPSVWRPQLAGPFEDLVLNMLAKDPAARPTAAEIATGTAHPPAVRRTAAGHRLRPPASLPEDRLVTVDDLFTTTEPTEVQQPAPAHEASQNTEPQHGPSPRSLRRRMAGFTAALTVVVATSVGLLLETRGERLPEVADLNPPSQPVHRPGTTLPKPTVPSTDPDPAWSDNQQAGADDSDDNRPGTTRPGTERPDADMSDAKRPGTDKSDTPSLPGNKSTDKSPGANPKAKTPGGKHTDGKPDKGNNERKSDRPNPADPPENPDPTNTQPDPDDYLTTLNNPAYNRAAAGPTPNTPTPE